jgi:hypothetical protein
LSDEEHAHRSNHWLLHRLALLNRLFFFDFLSVAELSHVHLVSRPLFILLQSYAPVLLCALVMREVDEVLVVLGGVDLVAIRLVNDYARAKQLADGEVLRSLDSTSLL